ncbi:MAG: hypothetical protein BYD32DRAFT_404104 [Podila humilis]|nr:MAG: hypothetical protein BYD32DRAFT_404104 [Podila humilis]
MTRLYRFTHNNVELVSDDTDAANQEVNTGAINIPNLVMFSAVLFMTEFRKMGMGDTDVSKTCNMSDWRRRMYAGTGNSQEVDEDIDIMDLPAKHSSQAGVIYAATTQEPEDKESFTAFLFAYHKPGMSKTMPASRTAQTASELTREAQALVPSSGVTHIWLCGSDPVHRRNRYMSKCLEQLEQDVRAWKASGQGSGIMTVHTIPAAFPGMVQFLLKNGFQGGDLVVGGESGKVLYWKEV